MGQRYLLDTNICIHLINRRPGYEALLDRIGQYSYGDLLISAITYQLATGSGALERELLEQSTANQYYLRQIIVGCRENSRRSG